MQSHVLFVKWQLRKLELNLLTIPQEKRLSTEHAPKLVLLKFAQMEGDKHSFAFFKGREQVSIGVVEPDILSHTETIETLREFFEGEQDE